MTSPTIALPPLETTPTRVKTDAEFVRKLLAKTEEKKLIWTKDGQTYKTKIASAKLSIDLETANQAIFGIGWTKFTINSKNEEIIRVEGGGSPFSLLIGSGTSAVTKAIDDLLAYLEGARSREVKRAIIALEEL